LGGAEADDVLEADDDDEGGTRVEGVGLGAEMGGCDEDDDEAEFEECPTCGDARLVFRNGMYGLTSTALCLPMIIPQAEWVSGFCAVTAKMTRPIHETTKGKISWIRESSGICTPSRRFANQIFMRSPIHPA